MTDLFTTKPKPPLAELLRPKTLDEFVGQRHLLGPGKPLRLAFEAGKLHSFILWGCLLYTSDAADECCGV